MLMHPGCPAIRKTKASSGNGLGYRSMQREELPLIKPFTLSPCAVRLILTALAGSIGGICLVAAWWRFGILVLCMLCVGLVLGFLVSSVTFFTPLGRRCVTDGLCVHSIVSKTSFQLSKTHTTLAGTWGPLLEGSGN